MPPRLRRGSKSEALWRDGSSFSRCSRVSFVTSRSCSSSFLNQKFSASRCFRRVPPAHLPDGVNAPDVHFVIVFSPLADGTRSFERRKTIIMARSIAGGFADERDLASESLSLPCNFGTCDANMLPVPYACNGKRLHFHGLPPKVNG